LRFECSTYHDKWVRAEQAWLSKRIRHLAETHRRYGYRKILAILLRDAGG
jgi:putative transposase